MSHRLSITLKRHAFSWRPPALPVALQDLREECLKLRTRVFDLEQQNRALSVLFQQRIKPASDLLLQVRRPLRCSHLQAAADFSQWGDSLGKMMNRSAVCQKRSLDEAQQPRILWLFVVFSCRGASLIMLTLTLTCYQLPPVYIYIYIYLKSIICKVAFNKKEEAAPDAEMISIFTVPVTWIENL